MCLTYLDKFRIPSRYGYKIFFVSRDDEEIYGDYHTPEKYESHGYPLNEWIKADELIKLSYYDTKRSRYLYTDDKKPYLAGFHCFLTEEAAQQAFDNYMGGEYFKIYKVEMRNIVAKGLQVIATDDTDIALQCVVAREMKILNEIPLKKKG